MKEEAAALIVIQARRCAAWSHVPFLTAWSD